MIFKCFPDKKSHDNCTVLLYVDGLKEFMHVKIGDGHLEMIINKMGRICHVTSPNYEYDITNALVDSLDGLLQFESQNFFIRWWTSREVDEGAIKSALEFDALN